MSMAATKTMLRALKEYYICIYLYMYVCIYVCMCVCIYVMYVSSIMYLPIYASCCTCVQYMYTACQGQWQQGVLTYSIHVARKSA